MTNAPVLAELQHAIHRLADAVDDTPPVARALRHFAARLVVEDPPAPRRPLRDPSAIRPLLYRALADGALDARGFDHLMLARARAARILAGRATAQAR